MSYESKIIGTGSFHPSKVLSNSDLEKMVDTTDEWISERTGMKERRIVDPHKDEFPSDMGYEASKKAIEMAGINKDEIDCIIFATTTPDFLCPNTACLVQTKLGLTNNCAAFDLQAACTGFVYGFNAADSFIKSGMFKTVLVIGCDMISSKIDYTDRNSCILFGDGCGVALLTRSTDESAVLSTVLRADGKGEEYIKIRKGGCADPILQEDFDTNGHFIRMQGRETFKEAVKTMASNAMEALEKAGLKKEDVDWFIPHQANMRIIEATAKRLDFPLEKTIINIEKFANTSAGTVPSCLDEGVRDGRIKRGDIVLFDAFGAGLTSGATVVRF